MQRTIICASEMKQALRKNMVFYVPPRDKRWLSTAIGIEDQSVYCLTPQKQNYQEKPKIWDKKGRIYKVNLWTDNELDGNANGLTDTMVTQYTKHCDLDGEAAEMLAADTKFNRHDCRMFKSYRYNWSNALIEGDGATRKGFFHRGQTIITFVDAYVIL